MDKLTDDDRLALWSAIEAFVNACGGSMAGPPTNARMNAVALVERAAERIGHHGLRDFFAAHAPAEIPRWFVMTPLARPRQPEIPPALERQRQRVRDWLGDGPVDLEDALDGPTAAEIEAARGFERAMRDFHDADGRYAVLAEQRRFIEWRFAYAELMLEARGREGA